MQDWASILPEPLRSMLLAVVATAGALIGLNRIASRKADEDVAQAKGPAGAVLKAALDSVEVALVQNRAAVDKMSGHIEVLVATIAASNRLAQDNGEDLGRMLEVLRQIKESCLGNANGISNVNEKLGALNQNLIMLMRRGD